MPRSVWVEGPLALGHHWDRQFSGQEQQGHCVCVSDFSHRSELSVLKHQEKPPEAYPRDSQAAQT